MSFAPDLAREVLGMVAFMAADGETLFEAAERILVLAGMQHALHSQVGAAAVLRVAPRVLNYRLERLGRRPKDVKETPA